MARPPAPVPVPEALQHRLRTQLGDEADALLAALDRPSPVSIRLNPAKPAGNEIIQDRPTGSKEQCHGEPAEQVRQAHRDSVLDLEGARPIPWCATGRYLAERPVFTLDPLLHAGCYYVQEAASMLLEQAFRASGLAGHDIAALDLCAAPGGKSTHLATLLSPGSWLVSNEVDRKRRPAMMENLWKWGRPGHTITGDGPDRFAALGPLFDLIVVDAPCSGEGMMRKDPFARQQWSPKLVERCVLTQRTILDAAWSALVPGGVLIYSTCTWSEAEDDGALEHLLALGAEIVPLPDLSAFGVLCTRHGAVAFPHRVNGEGFFIGMVRKPGERRHQGAERTGAHDTFLHQGVQHRIQHAWAKEISLLVAHVHTVAPGTPWRITLPDGREAPHEAAAHTGAVEGITDLPLDQVQALSFLRGEALRTGEAPSGTWRRVTYAGHGLGFVRGAGNRWNNLLPAAWRIRMR